MSRVITLITFIFFVFSFLSGCEEEGGRIEVKEGIAARVAGEEITDRDVDKRFNSLPRNQQKEFSGDVGRSKLIDNIIEEKLVYRAALDNKLQYKEEVKQQLDYSREMILIRAYYKHLLDEIKITDKEIEEYYDNHPVEFKAEPTLKAKHLFTTDSLKAAEWVKEIRGSEYPVDTFNRIAKEESEDSTTAATLGNLGYFHPDGYIKFYGFDENFGNKIAWMEEGEVSDVIPNKKGYSVIKLKEKKEATIKPLGRVAEKIREKLRDEEARNIIPGKINELHEKYEARNFLWEKLISQIRTADEFWELAQEESDPKQKIQYYRSIATKYPGDKLASQALFMIAFTYAEEIGDLSFARRTIDELISKYPDAEIVESAKWLRNNLGKSALKFESVEEMEKEMDKE